MSLFTLLTWRYNVELDKQWKLMEHSQAAVCISDPPVGESSHTIEIAMKLDSLSRTLRDARTIGEDHCGSEYVPRSWHERSRQQRPARGAKTLRA